jgi:hypothetical protein
MSNSDKLQRVRYFTGQVLGVDDFNTEQNYLIEKHRLHNRHQHGWGVVNGLKVSVDKGNVVHVSPGLAIDCVGNEILLCSAQELAAPGKAGEFYVVMEYFETEVSPVPSTPSTGGSAEPALNNSRVQEGFRVCISNINPNAKHTRIGPGTAGCGAAHPIAITRLQKKRNRWTLVQCGRRRSTQRE